MSDNQVRDVLTVIASAESIEPSITEYRAKLQQLQLLECSEKQERKADFTISLNFLLGNLYINFRLLWEPVSKLIISYAKMLPVDQFWPVFIHQLCLVVDHIEKGVTLTESHNFKRKYPSLY